MRSKTYSINRRQSLILALSAVIVTCGLIFHPLRVLLAGYYYRAAVDTLDIKATEYRDVKEVSDETIPDYINALISLKKGAGIHPYRSGYYKALADMYMKLGNWASAMETMNAKLPSNAYSSRNAYENAVRYVKAAIDLEPTNADYHLLLGQLYDLMDAESSLSEKELTRAINASPVNAPLRYAVAREYLQSGRKGDALEQAGILAKIDTSYMRSNPQQNTSPSEGRPPADLSLAYRSYLFGALEIAWRVSGDPEVVKGIAPDNPDAGDVVQLFLEWKGLNY